MKLSRRFTLLVGALALVAFVAGCKAPDDIAKDNGFTSEKGVPVFIVSDQDGAWKPPSESSIALLEHSVVQALGKDSVSVQARISDGTVTVVSVPVREIRVSLTNGEQKAAFKFKDYGTKDGNEHNLQNAINDGLLELKINLNEGDYNRLMSP